MTGKDGTATTRCRACGADVPTTTRCARCGSMLGAPDPCPCCAAEAGTSPHAELRHACDVCGGPRVARLNAGVTYSGRERPHLVAADRARTARSGWRAAAAAAGLLLPVTLLVLTALVLLFGAKGALLAAGLLVVAPIAGFLAFALRSAAARGREIAPALDAAWLSAASDVVRETQGATAETLVRALGVDERRAEELLAQIELDDIASPMRVRIQADAPPDAPAAGDVAEAEAIAAEARPTRAVDPRP